MTPLARGTTASPFFAAHQAVILSPLNRPYLLKSRARGLCPSIRREAGLHPHRQDPATSGGGALKNVVSTRERCDPVVFSVGNGYRERSPNVPQHNHHQSCRSLEFVCRGAPAVPVLLCCLVGGAAPLIILIIITSLKAAQMLLVESSVNWRPFACR